jgi:hypothetical protein
MQVLSRDGRWTALRVDINEVAVLVGHTLSFATAGQLPAALHRVVVQPSPAAAAAAAVGGGGFSRLSLAFKLRAAPGAVLDASALTGTPSAALLPRWVVTAVCRPSLGCACIMKVSVLQCAWQHGKQIATQITTPLPILWDATSSCNPCVAAVCFDCGALKQYSVQQQ